MRSTDANRWTQHHCQKIAYLQKGTTQAWHFDFPCKFSWKQTKEEEEESAVTAESNIRVRCIQENLRLRQLEARQTDKRRSCWNWFCEYAPWQRINKKKTLQCRFCVHWRLWSTIGRSLWEWSGNTWRLEASSTLSCWSRVTCCTPCWQSEPTCGWPSGQTKFLWTERFLSTMPWCALVDMEDLYWCKVKNNTASKSYCQWVCRQRSTLWAIA